MIITHHISIYTMLYEKSYNYFYGLKNMYNNLKLWEKSVFKNSPLSNREAFLWLIDNSSNGLLRYSLRNLGAIWQWHFSAVKRFLDKLKDESLVEISILSKTMVIKISDHYILEAKNYNQIALETKSEQKRNNIIASELDFEANLRTKPQQDSHKKSSEVIDCNNLCNNINEHHSTAEDNHRTIFEQSESKKSMEEEKKKRTKKRKEEIKEKNIPYGDTKKENLAENLDLQVGENQTHIFKKNQIPVHLVAVSDIAVWARETLPFELDLSWELGKFQDYWNIAPKKPPKDGLSAFRNWLRRAIEIKQGEGKNDRLNYKTTRRETDFEKFVAGGARAIAGRFGNRLDREDAGE